MPRNSAAIPSASGPLRAFDFARDTFAFENQTHWQYKFDAAGKMSFSRSEPAPSYAHRCFVLTRAARQFFYHARFDPAQPAPSEAEARKLIRAVVSRPPRQRAAPGEEIIIGGASSLREFSAAHGAWLKAECGGAWRSYVLRSHWRMVFPISREHQTRTAASLSAAVRDGVPPIIHLVKFPALTINHSMLVYGAAPLAEGEILFDAYDPNNPSEPSKITFNRAAQTFSLPRNLYWAGDDLNIIEIYRSWVM